jgi:site-specific recombinase XerD
MPRRAPVFFDPVSAVTPVSVAPPASASPHPASSTQGSSPPASSVPVTELRSCAAEYLLHCEHLQQSPRTLEAREMFLRNLLWFLERRRFAVCGVAELRQFFHYLRHGHEEPGGRWGQPRLTTPLRPVSVKDYYVGLQAFFKWLVAEEVVEVSPFHKIERPRVREEVKQPLEAGQVQALLLAARGSTNPRRDECILLMLFDSGVRASELIQLKVRDVDLGSGSFEVRGKGDKKRTCYLGRATTKSLMAYLRRAKLPPAAPLFPASTGSGAGKHLTRSGLLHLVKRIAKAAGVSANVHQLRRTFATTILQNGSDLVAVRDMLGHSSIHMTLKYLAVSQSHIQAQHRRCSPADRMEAGE